MLTKATSAVAKKCQNILLTMCDKGARARKRVVSARLQLHFRPQADRTSPTCGELPARRRCQTWFGKIPSKQSERHHRARRGAAGATATFSSFLWASTRATRWNSTPITRPAPIPGPRGSYSGRIERHPPPLDERAKRRLSGTNARKSLTRDRKS
jgi:hypothetical protein